MLYEIRIRKQFTEHDLDGWVTQTPEGWYRPVLPDDLTLTGWLQAIAHGDTPITGKVARALLGLLAEQILDDERSDGAAVQLEIKVDELETTPED